MRGQDHVGLCLLRDDCEIVAIADPDAWAITETVSLCEKAGRKKPAVYGNGNYDFLKLLENKNVDAVIIASPWIWHTQQAVAAMKAGKYTATEVGGAFNIDECWQLVNTHEATGSHLFFMENVCYRRDVMAVLGMVKKGMFGEMVHLECGYQHDLREVKFNDGVEVYGGGVEFGEKARSEAKWRTTQSQFRNGDLYPTHGIGPVAQYLGINRGNRFMYLTSTASKSRGLHDYITHHPKGGEAHPNAKVEWKLGDVITSVLKTINGETIIISHDTSLPRPYSLGFRVQGTKGIWMDINQSLHIEGVSEKHRWEKTDKYWGNDKTMKTHDHPLWQKYFPMAEGAGHGGMDWFLINAFVESAKQNIAPPIDVYDAATWLAITTLSEASIAAGSTPQAFPDFTRGRWTERVCKFGEGEF